jgi:hypothetical protein
MRPLGPSPSPSQIRREIGGKRLMMVKLVAALSSAQEYLELATTAEDRGERERYERIAELYLKIAQELEALIDN